MVRIIARGTKDGIVNLYVRLYKKNVINNAVSLGVTLNTMDWQVIERTLLNTAEAQKQGCSIPIRDTLANTLWSLRCKLDALLEAGDLTVSDVRKHITSAIRHDYIKEVEAHEAEKQAEIEKKERVTLIEWIEEYIRQCETGERLKRKSAKTITSGTIKSYRGTLSQLIQYQEKRHRIIDFDDVTLDFYDDWRRFFIQKTDKRGNPRPYSPNTIGRHVKNLKIFLYAAKDMKLTTSTDFENSRFSADAQEVENVYLTDERVQQLYEVDFGDYDTIQQLIQQAPSAEERDLIKDQVTRRTPELLNEAKDIFVVGCLTGQRVSDYKRINTTMFKTLSDGNEYIHLQQEKTGKWIYIPLDIRVRVILQKYGGKLPHIYDQDLNERIKIIGRLLGWRENAGITEIHGLMQVPTKKKFYECIKTHTARRTFATNAYKHKISLSSIMIITGHSSERMLRKYLKLDNEERAILAAAEFAKAREVRLKIAK